MRYRALAVVTLLIVASHGESGELKVRALGGQVDVEARAAALADVLARISQATGMKVVYEGPPPRQRITVDLKHRTPADAVAAVLEGTGLSYGLTIENGDRVQTLIVSTTPTSGAASQSRTLEPADRSERPRRVVPEAEEVPNLADPEEPEPFVPDEVPPVFNAVPVNPAPVNPAPFNPAFNPTPFNPTAPQFPQTPSMPVVPGTPSMPAPPGLPGSR